METITFQCANCRQVLKVGADKAGRPAKCPRCGTPLQVPTVSAESLPPPSDAARPKRKPTEDVLDDQEELEGRVSPKAPPRRGRDRDEEDEDDRPRRRRRDEEDEDNQPRRRRRDEEDEVDDRGRRSRRDDEVDDEDDRPRRRRRDDEDDEDDRPRGRRRDDEDDYDDDDRGRRRGKRASRGMTDRQKWQKVKLGTFLVFIAICILAGACLPHAIFYLLLTIEAFKAGAGIGGPGSGKFAEVLMMITEILTLGYAVLAIVGYCFCLLAPNRNGALGLAIATLAVAVAHLVMFIIFEFLPVFKSSQVLMSGSPYMVWTWRFLVQLLFSAPLILFPLFLQAVGKTFKDRGYVNDCTTVVAMTGGYTGERVITYILYLIMIKSPSRALGWIGLILIWIGFGIFVALMYKFIQLTQRAGDVVE